jgi:hypothetical protein
MFDCANDILAFHDDKTTLPQKERTAMRDRRNANRDRLKGRLAEGSKPTPKEFIKQGSYAMLTMVQDSENDYDIDDGVYFTQASLVVKGEDMTAEAAKKLVADALQDDRFNYPPKALKNCVRVLYHQGFHVDLPVYRIRTDNGQYELACGDAWVISRAADVEEWFYGANKEKSPDVGSNGGQFRRAVRLLKRFARSRTTWKKEIASGFTVTKLAEERFVGDSAREDIALRNCMRSIHSRLLFNLEVKHPVTPGGMLTSGPADPGTTFLREKLGLALKDLEILDDPKCDAKQAAAAWDKVFNTSFFSGRVESRKAAAAASNSLLGTPVSAPALSFPNSPVRPNKPKGFA